MINTIKELMSITGVSGRESAVCEYIKAQIAPYVDEISVDTMGNLIARKKGNGKKIMLCAHMDEIGFFATSINDNGTVNIAPVGGINYIHASYSEVVSENGVFGVILGADKDVPKCEDLHVNIGAKTKAQALKRVKPGDSFAFAHSMKRLSGTRYIGRPFDDRIGCAILVEALKEIKEAKNDLYFVFSVQEEVGGRGAKTASYTVSPDIGIALDVTMAGPKGPCTLGKGCAIKIKDSGAISDINLVRKMQEVAKNNGVKYQDEILLMGGTDASAMQITGAGASVGAISIPTENIHTSAELIDLNDVKEAIKLCVLLCSEL